MATQTENYKLTKPGGTDLIDIEVLNKNFDIIDEKLKELDGIRNWAENTFVRKDDVAGGIASKLKITFGSDFCYQQYTITGGDGESYTGTVPGTGIVEQTIKTLDTTYTVTCASPDGVSYSKEIVVGNFYGIYPCEFYIFRAYITCTTDEGATVTAVCGDMTYTGTIYRGRCSITVREAGTYTLTATLLGKTTSPVTVDVTTAEETYTCNLHSILSAVSWATGTDEEVVAVAAALDAGTLSIGDCGWAVGDKRTVQLSAMDTTFNIPETYEAQAVELVLSHAGATAGITRADGKPIHFQIDQVDCLKERGIINLSTATPVSWDGCDRRTWCHDAYYAAIPATLRPIFKKMKVTTAETYNGTTLKESEDFFALRAEKEIFGVKTKSNDTEADALEQVEWYKTAENRKKQANGEISEWWERSPCVDGSNSFCCVSVNGLAHDITSNIMDGIAPFGCI